MNRTIIAAMTLLAAAASFAQTATPAPPSEQEKIIVAVVNGEVITKAKLDALYKGMPAQVRAQFERSGGKMAYLDTYVSQRLLIQEAMKSGFDKHADVQAAVESAKETALFEKYVRDVVAPGIVTDADVHKYYDEHKSDFALPESAKVRHIVIGWNKHSKPDAMDLIKQVATEIRAGAPSPRDRSPEYQKLLLARFSDAARRYSEDGSAPAGGDLGWVSKGALDPSFAAAAFAMEPMRMSGIVESQFGYHLIFVEEKKPAGTQSFDEVQQDVREYLMQQHAADIMGSVKRLTNELRANSRIAFYPENVR